MSAHIIDNAYKLIRPIGEGGMATVYLAEVDISKVNYTLLYAYTQVQAESHSKRVELAEELAKSLEGEELDWKTIRKLLEAQKIPVPPEKVALKLAHQGIRPERFEDEWKYLICLNNPNVVKVFGGGAEKGRPYYAMELLPGMINQKEIIENFTVEEKLKVVFMAGKGLDYLHKNGIIHRDIKPDNFITLKNKKGQMITKVTDLGLAKDTSAEMGMTGSAAVLGTPYFMSPEQMKSSRDIDPRTDVYSLGASLYEFMTGKKPFHDKTSIVEILKTAVDRESPIPPESHVEGFPKELGGILKCSMAQDSENRYKNMREFLRDLKSFIQADAGQLSQTLAISSDLSNVDFTSSEYIFESKSKDLKGNSGELKKSSVSKGKKKSTGSGKSRQKKSKHQPKNLNSIHIYVAAAIVCLFLVATLILLKEDKEALQPIAHSPSQDLMENEDHLDSGIREQDNPEVGQPDKGEGSPKSPLDQQDEATLEITNKNPIHEDTLAPVSQVPKEAQSQKAKDFSFPLGQWTWRSIVFTVEKDQLFSSTHRDWASGKWEFKKDKKSILLTSAAQKKLFWGYRNDSLFIEDPSGSPVRKLPYNNNILPDAYSPIGQWKFNGRVFTILENGIFSSTHRDWTSGQWFTNPPYNQIVLTRIQGDKFNWNFKNERLFQDAASGSQISKSLANDTSIPNGFSPIGQWKNRSRVFTLKDGGVFSGTHRDWQSGQWYIDLKFNQIVIKRSQNDSMLWNYKGDVLLIDEASGSQVTKSTKNEHDVPRDFSPIAQWKIGNRIFNLNKGGIFSGTNRDWQSGQWSIDSDYNQIVIKRSQGDKMLWNIKGRSLLLDEASGTEVTRSSKSSKPLPKKFSPIGTWEMANSKFNLKEDNSFDSNRKDWTSGQWNIDPDYSQVVIRRSHGDKLLWNYKSSQLLMDEASGAKVTKVEVENQPEKAHDGEWTDILQRIKLPDHRVGGVWTMRNNELHGSAKSTLVTDVLLPTEYEIEWEFQSNSTAINLLLPSPIGGRFEWMVKGWSHSLCGIRCVDGREANENPTTTVYAMASNQKYLVRVRVLKDRFVAFINDEEVLNYETDWDNVAITVPWNNAVFNGREFGIWCNKHVTTTTILRYRPL